MEYRRCSEFVDVLGMLRVEPPFQPQWTFCPIVGVKGDGNLVEIIKVFFVRARDGDL